MAVSHGFSAGVNVFRHCQKRLSLNSRRRKPYENVYKNADKRTAE